MTYDIAVVGGGIVGLATLRELGLRFPSLRLALIEKEARLSAHQSGHNSGVVHSGIYYAPGSHKARLCIDGRRRLLAYCDEKSIGYRRTGKIIVATRESELTRLDVLLQRGRANGVEGLEMLDAAAIAEREPHVRGLRAIAVPSTCIVDFARVATAYGDDARRAGAAFYLGTEVRGIVRERGVTRVRTTRDELAARAVVTCGGLFADRLARMSGGGADFRASCPSWATT